MLNLISGLFLLYAVLVLLRVLRGPTIWDRILGLNLFSAIIIMLILLIAIIEDLNYLVDIAIVYSLLGFISIIFISRFVQRKGKL
ncbi:MAG: monovalent cation/H+ antiporter complex subunit F [Vallitaleaceae bacterium]|jgi:multicomponent Na+:H+ antiporter subunit F|nr:monovalent cation/H+ antiporter complex subunit F [Vallitaleaceae bacterium]